MRSLILLFGFCLLIFQFFGFSSAAHQGVFVAQSVGDAFGRGSHEPKYDIQFHSLDFPYQPDDDQESVIMSYQNGSKYMCFLPKIEDTKKQRHDSQQNSSTMIMEADRNVKLKTPDELLAFLKSKCLVRLEGWWTYELCYHGKFRQFHHEENKVVQEFILGEYDPEATAAFHENSSATSTLKDPRSKDATHRYHSHLYTNGTVCDLTGQPRETEVMFVCAEMPRVAIGSIKEVSTCKYAVTIQCPMLCKHPMFQEERTMWHTVKCNEMPRERQEPAEDVGSGILETDPEHKIPVHSEERKSDVQDI